MCFCCVDVGGQAFGIKEVVGEVLSMDWTLQSVVPNNSTLELSCLENLELLMATFLDTF